MAFTTSGQETEWALFLQPRSPHGQLYHVLVQSDVPSPLQILRRTIDKWSEVHKMKQTNSSMRLLPRSSVLSLARHDSEAGKYLMRFSRNSNDSRLDRLNTYKHQPRSPGHQCQQWWPVELPSTPRSWWRRLFDLFIIVPCRQHGRKNVHRKNRKTKTRFK